MTDTPPAETRTCSKCGQVDDHPHHVQYTAFTHPVTGEAQDLSITKHVDCCAEDGCPICGTDMKFAPEGAHGETMRTFLMDKSDEHQKALFEEQNIQTPAYTVTFTEEAPA
jgi:hypothetical protein